MRQAREKHYAMEDGTIKAYLYDDDIHYLENGEFKEIDNTIVEKTNYYENKENNFKVEFPKDKRHIYRIKTTDYKIDLSLEKDKSPKTKIETYKNSIVLKDVMDNIDFKYDITGAKLKETIVLKKQLSTALVFTLHTDLDLVLDNGLIKGQKNGITLYKIAKAFMVDATGSYSDSVMYKLTKRNSNYILEIKPDKFWLEKATYPISLDPTIIDSTGSQVYDTYIYEGDTSENRNAHSYLKIGVDKQGKKYRSLLKFDLPHIGTGAQIINARVGLYAHTMDYVFEHDLAAVPQKRVPISIHEVTVPWDEENANWATLNDKYSNRLEYYTEFMRCKRNATTMEYIPTLNEIELTRLVKNWYSGKPNNGIMIKFLEETYDPECEEYYMISKNNGMDPLDENNPKPVLMITYRNQNGLLNYMSYNDFPFINGSTSININNGNLVTMASLNSTIGGKIPISIGLVYNTNDAVLTKYKKGWRFTLEETLYPKVIDNYDYLEYTDSSSNVSYFYKKSSTNENDVLEYLDEEGQNLSIKSIDNTFVMTDKEDNKKIFSKYGDIYLLTKIVDSKSNDATIEYDDQKRITKIIDANQEEITISYQTNKIDITSSNRVTSVFFTNDLVSKITTIYGSTNFTYDEKGLIEKIKDENNTGIKFVYYDTNPYRIKKVIELGTANSEGKSQFYEYGYNTTKLTDEKNICYTYTFNDEGNTIGTTIMDEDKNLIESYGFNERYVEAFRSKKKNHLASATNILRSTVNILENPSFEGNSNQPFFLNGSLTDEYARTGKHSWKGNLNLQGALVIDTIPEGKTLTFSGYAKSASEIFVYAQDTNKSVFNGTIPASNDFIHFEFPFVTTGKSVMLNFTSDGDFYIDDIQLEEGEVASLFNLIPNGDFKRGTNGWNISLDVNEESDDNNGATTVAISTLENALKFESAPNKSISASYNLNLEGKKGDVYNLSFWYKNEGVMDTNYEFVGNMVNLQFAFKDQTLGIGTNNAKMNFHDTEWQFFSESFVAEADYQNCVLNIMSINEANSLYITNIMLTKDLGQYTFNYDEEGNLLSTTDLSGAKNELNYDKDNQLIAAFTPKGNHYKYEYDNDNPSRILKGISPSGISNEIEYDVFGNPRKTIIKNSGDEEAPKSDIYYNIRLKGTKKYIDYDFIDKEFLIKENGCSHKRFLFEKVQKDEKEYYKIKFTNDYLTYYNENIVLSRQTDDSTLFTIIKNKNGSISLSPKIADTKALFYQTEALKVHDRIEDFSEKFYLEPANLKKFIETEAVYTEDGKFISKIIDNLGKETLYETDPIKGLTTKEIDAKGNEKTYTYTQKDQIKTITSNDKTISYTYDDQNQLSKITSGQKEYTFEHDEFLNPTSININNIALVNNVYEPKNGNLINSTYGTGASQKYIYDKYNRLKSLENDDTIYKYTYDTRGNVVKITSPKDNYQYFYDYANRLSDYLITTNKFSLHSLNSYDTGGQLLTKKTETDISGLQIPDLTLAYNKDDLVTKLTYGSIVQNYLYDELGRVIEKNINNDYKITYSYMNRGDRTSLIVKSLKIADNLYEYKYDDLYNITDIYLNGDLLNHYSYDNFNQLIKDDNYALNKTSSFTYDNEGNILSKTVHTLGTEDILKQDTFEYNNPLWEDQLTKYNEENITYDEIGNPLTIGSKTLTWKNGRELKKYVDSINNLTVDYDYSKDGIRLKKTINNVTTDYLIDGSSILVEKTGNNVLYFIRDDNNSLIGLNYNGTTYYYVKNLQEDIIGLMDSEFETIATYSYDSWGKIVSIKDQNNQEIIDQTHIANINPYRYRSYYYDKETGLYYLKSRYYNPEWSRFINADPIVYTGQDFCSCNNYCYTGNNYINRKDSEGLFWFPVIVGVTSGIIKALFQETANQKYGTTNNLILAFSSGFIDGILASTAFGYTPLGKILRDIGMPLVTNIAMGSENILIDSMIDIGVGKVTGQIADIVSPINSGWFRPKHLDSTIFSTYTHRLITRYAISEYVPFITEIEEFKKMMEGFLNWAHDQYNSLVKYLLGLDAYNPNLDGHGGNFSSGGHGGGGSGGGSF